MRILLTNDDGMGSEGLTALTQVLSQEHEVCVFAPDRERSGVSHALTLGSAGMVRKIGAQAYTCSGTPADCVILALLGAIDFVPEIVVSGINRGPNLGTDIVYSGTCAAAREAVLGGLPGIAVSCAAHLEILRYGAAASFILKNLHALVAACSNKTFINVNTPSTNDEILEAEWSSPCRRVFENTLTSFDGPDGFRYCFLGGGDSGIRHEVASDYEVVAMGKVSLSPILVQPQVPVGFLSGQSFR